MKNPKISQILTKPKTIILLIILTLLLILIPLYIYLDIQSRNAFNILQNDMNKIEQTTIIPAGGVLQGSNSLGTNLYERAIACYLRTCPTISTSWVVPIEAGGDDIFVRRMLSEGGYSADPDSQSTCLMNTKDINKGNFPNCIYFGHKNSSVSNAQIMITVQLADDYHDKIPNNSSVPKDNWRRITISIFRS